MKIAIIGGGACGLLCATLLEKYNINYTIFNKGKIGNKILASGNGRCNIANASFNASAYHNNPLATNIVSNYQNKLFDYFNELKIYTKADNEGRMYPISESSQSVLNALLRKIKGEIIDVEVNNITQDNNKYIINDTYKYYDKIILSSGSIASYKPEYSFINYLSSLNIKINEFKPSLVGFKTSLKLKPISGVRCKCITYLYNNDELIHKEAGEVIFKDDGISGICIMNQSSYYNHIDKLNKPYIKLDLLNDNQYDDYITILNPKLLEFINKNNLNPSSIIIPISSTYDYVVSQVCSGGIDINDINNNLSLKNNNAIYVGGELIDVDGVCGGYNLMFAFSCAMKIAEEIKNEISN